MRVRLVTEVTFANQVNLRLLFSDTPLTWNPKQEAARRIISTDEENLLPLVSHLVSRFLESLIIHFVTKVT